MRSGVVGDAQALAKRTVRLTLVSAIVFVPTGLLLVLLLGLPFAALCLVPTASYFATEIRLRDRVSARREGVERELPFFSILVNVLGSAGVPLYTVFTGIINTRIFEALRNEALLVRRDVSLFGMDPNETFEQIAANHPSQRFSAFLYGYTSKVRSGGDISSYLLGESGALLRELEESWSRFARRAGLVGSTMVTLFGVVPLLLLVVGVFSPSNSSLGLTGFAAVGIPVFTVLLVYAAGRMQPAGEAPLSGAVDLSLLFSTPGLAIGALLHQPWVSAGATLFLFTLVYGLSVRRQRIRMAKIDEALPGFVKDVLEFKRQEYDLSKSLTTISSKNRYNPPFDQFLAGVSAQLKAGSPLDEVAADPGTKLSRLIFFVLATMSRSGGGTVETVFQLSTYTDKVVEMKRSSRAEMRPYVFLACASPVLLAFGMTLVSSIVGAYGSVLHSGVAYPASIHLGGPTNAYLLQLSNVLILASATALGIVSAKVMDSTVKNTLRPCLNVGLAAAAIAVMSSVSPLGLLGLH